MTASDLASAPVAGVDIGGTKISVVLTDAHGFVSARRSGAAPASEGGAAMLATVVRLLEEAEQDAGTRALRVGVGAAGVIDPRSGSIVAASDSFRGWAGFALRDELERATGRRTVVANDVNAFLTGELRWGAAAGRRHAVGIALGTGVGGAVALDGTVLEGPGGAAGEIGHIPGFGDTVCTCGRAGHLETVASGRSIARRYLERTGAEIASDAVARRAREGDPHAAGVFHEAARATALAAVTAATLFDIEDVVIGGGVREAWDLLQPGFAEVLASDSPVSGHPLRIRPSALHADAVALGAAAYAFADAGADRILDGEDMRQADPAHMNETEIAC
jgi:glucokinase